MSLHIDKLNYNSVHEFSFIMMSSQEFVSSLELAPDFS